LEQEPQAVLTSMSVSVAMVAVILSLLAPTQMAQELVVTVLWGTLARVFPAASTSMSVLLTMVAVTT